MCVCVCVGLAHGVTMFFIYLLKITLSSSREDTIYFHDIYIGLSFSTARLVILQLLHGNR